MDQDWDLSLRMTERYHWAHSVMHHHNELRVTKCLVTGSCITVRVKWLARDSIVGIPIPCSISLPASLFTRTVMHDPVANSLVTLSSLWWCITEWAQRYLSVIWSDKSQSRFVPTQQTLSEIPVMYLYSHPVTLWCLAHPKHSYGIRELHDLMVQGKDTWHWKNSSKRTIRSCAMFRIGSCPSHHSPNDVISLSMTSSVHSQETVTICWSTS